jgi:hypothetical protein
VQIVTLLLADEEWSKVRRVAEAAWPGAVLDRQMSRAEACRRLLMAGLNSIPNANLAAGEAVATT